MRGARSGLVVLALGACGGDAGHDAAVADVADVADGADGAPTSPWTIEVIGKGLGRQLQAAVGPDGRLAVAAYADAGVDDGPCGDAPADGERTRWALSFAVDDGTGWRTEDVAGIVHLGPPRGIDLAFAPDGTATIAALTGEPIPFYCGANDLALYRRGAGAGGRWTAEVVVADSDEAATGEPASDFGQVVGLWPALAFGAAGAPLVVYKDVHGGGLQADDFRRADLEGVAGGAGGAGGYRHFAIDAGAGAGDYNQVAFDGAGRAVVMMFHPRDELTDSRRGLWVLRSADVAAASPTWERVRVFAGGVSERPSLAIGADGALWVAWYDGEVGLPYVAHLAAGAALEEIGAWQIGDVGDHVYDEGRNPTLAVSPEGTVALAYQRCGRASDGIGDCQPAKDAIVLAWRDGDRWERELVPEPSERDAAAIAQSLCGDAIGLVFQGEAPVVFVQCMVPEAAGGFGTELRAARRRSL